MPRKLDEPQGRGAFFKALGTLMAGFVAERIEEAAANLGPALLRPPGALDELAFLTACTRCDKCLHACPHDAILKAGPGAGVSAGTPYLEPRGMPCFLCTELPCVPACPEEALVWPKRKVHGTDETGPRAVKMGTARISEARCLTYAEEGREAEDCRICVDRCPFPDEAITMAEPAAGALAHPRVDDDRCTGCGLCVFACPASAITVERR